MAEDTLLFSVMHGILSFIWVLLDFVIAGVVVYRFRATITSWLVAGGFVCFAFVRIISALFNWLVLPQVGTQGTGYFLSSAMFNLLYIFVSLIVAVGVGFIPRSLSKLAGPSTGPSSSSGQAPPSTGSGERGPSTGSGERGSGERGQESSAQPKSP